MPPIHGEPSVAKYVEQLIKENKVFIFSKTTCNIALKNNNSSKISVIRKNKKINKFLLGPWCAKVKALFTDLGEKYNVLELDIIGKYEYEYTANHVLIKSTNSKHCF